MLRSFLAGINPPGAERLASRLACEFDSLGGIFSASPGRLIRALDGDGDERVVGHVGVCTAIAARALQQRVDGRRIITSLPALVSYLRASLQHEIKEQTRVLFLDKVNGLIKDEVVGRGTVDHAPLYVREVIHRALDIGASAIVLAHNHPSGVVKPSQADRWLTRAVQDACKTLNITLHDHIIIGPTGDFTSFKQQGLL